MKSKSSISVKHFCIMVLLILLVSTSSTAIEDTNITFSDTNSINDVVISGTTTPEPTSTATATATVTPRTTPSQCPTGLIWNSTSNKCVAPPETSDDTYIYIA